jgi:hypothetical protein
MGRLNRWQWAGLGFPIAAIVIFLLIAAGVQIHQWGINWIWAIVVLMLVGWRWLLVRWTQPAVLQVQAIQTLAEPETGDSATTTDDRTLQQAEIEIQQILEASRSDPPFWEDWGQFWQRCQQLVVTIAHLYHPEVKHPFLNIYVPQAYSLIQGTTADLERWMETLSPALNQVTIGQVFQAYEIYQKLEPSTRRLWQVWNWAQWLLNPVAALAKVATQRTSNQANQQLLANLSQLLREAALRNLGRRAIALYSGKFPGQESPTPAPTLPQAKTQTLREILTQAEPVAAVEQKPVGILLVGRTGAGKSSLINTLFLEDKAAVDLLPSTDRLQDYHWQAETGEALTLWDTPGYEQADRADLRVQVLEIVPEIDFLLLLNPVLDPALQMDVDFLRDVKAIVPDLPIMTVITQVDRLRPLREWQPPYNWQFGDRPKEIAIREAVQYRAELLGSFCDRVLPIVTGDRATNRTAWGVEELSLALLETIAPAKQLRLARFLHNLDARSVAAAKIIDRYTLQMATTQGLTAMLKSPVLQFISTLTTGTPALAFALAEQIPVEQLPVVIGKLQMAYELFNLLNAGNPNARDFDLRSLWVVLLENTGTPDRNAWAFGHATVEYLTQPLTIAQFQERFRAYLAQ